MKTRVAGGGFKDRKSRHCKHMTPMRYPSWTPKSRCQEETKTGRAVWPPRAGLLSWGRRDWFPAAPGLGSPATVDCRGTRADTTPWAQPHVCGPSAPTSLCLRTHRCCCEHRDVPLALQIDGTGQALSGPPARHHLGSGPLEAAKAGPSWSPSCPVDRQKVQGPVGNSSSANPQSVHSRGPPCLSLPSPRLQPVEASQRSGNPPCLPVGQAPSRPADALGAPGSAVLLQACGAPLPLPPA